MKSILLLAVLTTSLANVQAQGTFQFTANLSGANEVPPNSSTGAGLGTFTLNGSALSYVISISYLQNDIVPSDGTINGPADSSTTAGVLFDLGAPTFSPRRLPRRDINHSV